MDPRVHPSVPLSVPVPPWGCTLRVQLTRDTESGQADTQLGAGSSTVLLGRGRWWGQGCMGGGPPLPPPRPSDFSPHKCPIVPPLMDGSSSAPPAPSWDAALVNAGQTVPSEALGRDRSPAGMGGGWRASSHCTAGRTRRVHTQHMAHRCVTASAPSCHVAPLRVPRGTECPSPALGCPPPQKKMLTSGAAVPERQECGAAAPIPLSQHHRNSAPRAGTALPRAPMGAAAATPCTAGWERRLRLNLKASAPHPGPTPSYWGSTATARDSSRVRLCPQLPQLLESQSVQEGPAGAE